jgi:hypothetical protein
MRASRTAAISGRPSTIQDYEELFAKHGSKPTCSPGLLPMLWRTIGQLLDAFSPTECTNYLAHAGYVPPHRKTL